MEDLIIDEIKAINKNPYSWGNQVLYDMCKKSDLKNEEHLSSKIWIIGRSYAASPERRSYGYDKDKIPLHNIKKSNDGTGLFFDVIAKDMVGGSLSDDYNYLIKNIEELKDKKYNYDVSDYDKYLIVKSLEAVLIFNELIKTASENFDELTKEELKEIHCKNQISFCSKFLHFHCKDVIYIFDQNSFAGNHLLFQYSGKKDLSIGSVKLSREQFRHKISISFEMEINKLLKNAVENLKEELKSKIKNALKDKYKDYITHFILSYQLSCYLKEDGLGAGPREVDNVLLKVKSYEK